MNEMSNSANLVSICIPFYKGKEYVLQTLRSVMNQTWQQWELVITDDASGDGTAEEIDRFVAEAADPRIRFFRNEERLGMVDNWNKVLGRARGQYIKLVCGDDWLRPDCVERQVCALEANPSAALTTSSRMIVNSAGQPLFVRACYRKTGLYNGREAQRQGLLAGTNTIGDPVAVMFRAELLQRTGPFAPSVVYCTDMDLWLRLLSYGDLHFIAEALAYYRIHHHSTGKALREETVQDFLRVVDRLTEMSGLRFSPFERFRMAAKSRIKSRLRQAVYRFLA
jgi:glycosyltransferase involved in cell wall biosynthesis